MADATVNSNQVPGYRVIPARDLKDTDVLADVSGGRKPIRSVKTVQRRGNLEPVVQVVFQDGESEPFLANTEVTIHERPDTNNPGTFQVTVGAKRHIEMLAALLYDDVKVLEQWENDDKVAIIWEREGDWLATYQRERLSSAWFPTYQGVPALQWLVEEMGLNIPCAQKEA